MAKATNPMSQQSTHLLPHATLEFGGWKVHRDSLERTTHTYKDLETIGWNFKCILPRIDMARIFNQLLLTSCLASTIMVEMVALGSSY